MAFYHTGGAKKSAKLDFLQEMDFGPTFIRKALIQNNLKLSAKFRRQK
jgi:hypothetical protein